MDCSAATCGGEAWLDCYGKGMASSRRSPFFHSTHVLHQQGTKVENPQQRNQAEGCGMRFDYATRNQNSGGGVLHLDTGARILTGDMKPTTCRALRPHSTPATLMWLDENYEVADGVCIPRSTLYMHYVDFCAKNSMQPVNAASFGKIIRQQFPQLTTRRLGTRGQSRYHYYGIAVRELSPYFQFTFSKKGATSYEARKEVAKQVSMFTPRMKTGAVLPDFPSIKDLNLPPSADIEKMTTFLMMYRTHCQRLLDTVVRASFDEVQNFVLHFWQGMPSHLSSILDTNVLVNLVGVCDCILYRTVCAALLPSMLHTLPDSLTKVVKKFMQELEGWLKIAMCHLPENIRVVKLEMASRFARMLRRQMSLNHLAQASRMVLNNADISRQMLSDWRQVDLDAICRETLYSTTGTGGEQPPHDPTSCEALRRLVKDFESLLEEAVPIDSYVEWLESLVNKCVIMPKSRRKCSRRMASQFLLIWSAFGTRVIRDMTLHSAASFGSFHLLRLMFDDYVLFLVETIHTEDQMKDFLINIANDAPPCFSTETMVPGYFNESCGLNVEHRSCSAETPVPDGYNCGPEPAAVSPPAQEVPSSSINTPYETADDEEQYACTWMPGEYYQSLYQDVQYENRRSWPSATVFSRPESKPYNYQQSTQYLIVSQDTSSARNERESLFTGPESGCVYGSHFAGGNKTEEALLNCNHPETASTPAIMYTASGAIYQSYTVVASPQEKGPDTCREKDRSRVHHVTLRMDGALYCNT